MNLRNGFRTSTGKAQMKCDKVGITVTYIPLIKAGTVLGIAFGGFAFGIMSNPWLQLAAASPRNSTVNIQTIVFWNGMLHMLTGSATVMGIAMLWRAGKQADVPWSGKTFLGSLFLGLGLFNLVERLADQQIPQLHQASEAFGGGIYDYAILGSGAFFILAGCLAIYRDKRRDPTYHVLAGVGKSA
jgi:uncharacterized membrane protein